MTTNYQINQVADREFGRVNNPPTTYYIALLTATPNPDGTGIVEVSTVGTGYARQALPNNKTSLSNSSNGLVTNLAQLNFPTVLASYGFVTDVAIFDSPNAGNLLYVTTQTVAKPFDVGDIAFFGIGDISWTVQNIL